MGKNRKCDRPVNVEFGHEFGDVNSAKLYEIPIAQCKNGKKKTEKNGELRT